jgi:hypothetical protein
MSVWAHGLAPKTCSAGPAVLETRGACGTMTNTSMDHDHLHVTFMGFLSLLTFQVADNEETGG